MSGKYNTQHNRSRGRYKARLNRRGLSRAPLLTPLYALRQRARTRDPEVGDERWLQEAEGM